MKKSHLEIKIAKIKARLEKSKIIDDCCEIAKRSCNYENKYGIESYIFSYKNLAISYLEDKEENGLKSGRHLIVRYETLEEVLHCERDDIKQENRPMVESEFGRFKVLTYLPKGGKWERMIKKIKKYNIPSRKIDSTKKEVDSVKDFKENFGF